MLGFSRKSHVLTTQERSEAGAGAGEDFLLSNLMRFLFEVWKKKPVKKFYFYYQELVGWEQREFSQTHSKT